MADGMRRGSRSITAQVITMLPLQTGGQQLALLFLGARLSDGQGGDHGAVQRHRGQDAPQLFHYEAHVGQRKSLAAVLFGMAKPSQPKSAICCQREGG